MRREGGLKDACVLKGSKSMLRWVGWICDSDDNLVILSVSEKVRWYSIRKEKTDNVRVEWEEHCVVRNKSNKLHFY